MHSSSEELRLLLTKWKNESRQVAIMTTLRGSHPRMAALYIEGSLQVDDPNSDNFGVIDGNSIAAINFTGCDIQYGRIEDVPELEMSDGVLLDREDFDECLVIYSPKGDGTCVIALSLKKQGK